MMLDVNNCEHVNYKIFNKDNEQIPLVQKYNTKTKEAQFYKADSDNNIISHMGVPIIYIEKFVGSYAVDENGKKVK